MLDLRLCVIWGALLCKRYDLIYFIRKQHCVEKVNVSHNTSSIYKEMVLAT